MKRSQGAHYLRTNDITRVPRRVVCFDSEAYRDVQGVREVQTFRLACASFTTWDQHKHGWRRSIIDTFTDPLALWTAIDACTAKNNRTVVVAHNLAYDLRITRALEILPALGWELKHIRLDRNQAWASWRRDGRTLSCCDLYAWLPMPLGRLGELLQTPKLDLPSWEDGDDAWRARCVRDVEILTDATLRLLQWVRDDDLGNWRPTGAGQSWSAFRHRFYDRKILVHDDEHARAAERTAAYAGRCEVWRHGRLDGGPFTEWDYRAAYAHVGAECDVPTVLAGTVTKPTQQQWLRLTKRFAVLAECEITASEPIAPTQHKGRIVWPTGVFRSTLWEQEVAGVLSTGGDVSVSRLWFYERAPVLRDFCRWVLAVLDPRSRGFDPVVVCAIKHFSRALVGRFGARWSEWETIGLADEMDVALSTVIDATQGCTYDLLQVGRTLKRRSEMFDAPDAVPQIMSWVMAECRMRLWRAMNAAGLDHVVYCDTDGLITDPGGTAALGLAAIPNLRRKGVWESIEALAPRQLVLEGSLRAAGIPRKAIRTGEHTYAGETWESLPRSIRAGSADRVHVAERLWRLSGIDHRRTHLRGGHTAALDLS